MGTGITLGSVGFAVIIRQPVYFRKHYGKLVNAIQADARGRLSTRIEFVIAKREETRHQVATGSASEFPDSAEDITYFQDESIEVVDGLIADCSDRVPRACMMARKIGVGLVVLAPVFMLSSVAFLDPPQMYPLVGTLSILLPAGVVFYILGQFWAYERLISRTEREFNSIPQEMRPEW